MPRNRALVVWLGAICALVVAMVVIGGITRLTHSGLSIVEWKPVTGALPPLTDAAWHAEFAKYQQFPEYQKLNQGMSLGEFKAIFFWEYLHRLVGRLIGVVVLVPWVAFALRRRIDRALSLRLLGGFLLGGLQGALGWFMVKSGLVDNPHVSHYRLAAHLVLALAILAYFFWLLLDLLPREERTEAASSRLAQALPVLVLLQIVWGAFTAGLRAGFGYNTFPTMNGEWILSGILGDSGLAALADNPVAVQFVHRCIAWVLLLAVGAFWLRTRRATLDRRQRLGVHLLACAVALQFLLGVATLLLVVPVSVASLHQLGACVLFLCALFVAHAFRPAPQPVASAVPAAA